MWKEREKEKKRNKQENGKIRSCYRIAKQTNVHEKDQTDMQLLKFKREMHEKRKKKQQSNNNKRYNSNNLQVLTIYGRIYNNIPQPASDPIEKCIIVFFFIHFIFGYVCVGYAMCAGTYCVLHSYCFCHKRWRQVRLKYFSLSESIVKSLLKSRPFVYRIVRLLLQPQLSYNVEERTVFIAPGFMSAYIKHSYCCHYFFLSMQ